MIFSFREKSFFLLFEKISGKTNFLSIFFSPFFFLEKWPFYGGYIFTILTEFVTFMCQIGHCGKGQTAKTKRFEVVI